MQHQNTDSRATHTRTPGLHGTGGNILTSVGAVVFLAPFCHKKATKGPPTGRISPHQSCFVIRRLGFESPRQLTRFGYTTRLRVSGAASFCAGTATKSTTPRRGGWYPHSVEHIGEDASGVLVTAADLRVHPSRSSVSDKNHGLASVGWPFESARLDYRVRTPLAALNGKTHVGPLSQIQALSYGLNLVVMAGPLTVKGGALSRLR